MALRTRKQRSPKDFESFRPRCKRRAATLTLLLLGTATLPLLASCEGKTDVLRDRIKNMPKTASLLDPTRLGEALKALLDPLPQPLRILTVKALHEQVIVQVQDSKDPTEVSEYRYREGVVSGPTKVTLLGSGKLQDNLFPLQAANPQVASEVVKNVASEYQSQGLKIRKLVMIRNLPRSRDIQFRVFLDGPDGVLFVKADKNGRLLGPPEPAPESFN